MQDDIVQIILYGSFAMLIQRRYFPEVGICPRLHEIGSGIEVVQLRHRFSV